jgi:hypothetical protein
MIIPRVDATAHDARWASRSLWRASAIKAGGSRTRRLAGGAGLAEGGRQVGDWLCESRTAKHCLNGYVDPSKARPTQEPKWS